MAQNNRSSVGDVVKNMDTSFVSTEGKSETSLDLLLLNIAKGEKAHIAANKRLEAAEKEWNERIFAERVKKIKERAATEQEADAEIYKLRLRQNEEIHNIAMKMDENMYKMSSISQKKKITEERKLTAQNTAEKIRLQMIEVANSDLNGNKKNKLLKDLNKQRMAAHKEEMKESKQEMKLAMAAHTYDSKSMQQKATAVAQLRQDERDRYQEILNETDVEIERLKEKEALAKKNGSSGAKFKKEREELEKDRAATAKEAKKSDTAYFGKELKVGLEKGLKAGIGGALDMMVGAFNKGVDDAIESVGQYRSFLEARLQGTDSGYDEVAKTLKQSLAASPYVKQTEVLQKLRDAVDKGIAYNVEQRAFLSTMTDKIVSTFDAFDSNLMRIIRLQQADTTGARMGMETNLLEFFNTTFSDNSYLQEGYDDVSKALVDANAQMTRDMSIAFEYNVQKWMGSLASLGFGTDTITKIATGINYLGSGNVAALAGDTQLQSLLAMSASRAGLSYSDLLVQGIDDSSVNTLLKSMVEYLAEIADDENAVVKAAYGDVFNFSQSDLRAIKNLNPEDITNIYSQEMSYSTAVDNLQSQLNQVGSRLSMTEMINNAFANFVYTAGESIGNSAAGAITWKMLTLIDSATGGDLKLPEITYLGTGINIQSSIPNLVKTGIFGLSALGQIGTIANSISSGNGLDLGVWGFEEYTRRGGDFESTVGGVQQTKSGSKTLTSASSADTKKQALSSTEEDQDEGIKRSKEASKDEITIETLYNELFSVKTPIYVIDSPLNSTVESIATAVSNTNTKIGQIHNLLSSSESGGIRAYVTNIDKTPTTTVPSSFSISKINDRDFIQELAKQIAQGVLGNNSTDSADGTATLSDIAYILTNGTIQVIDRTTQAEIESLKKDLY